jgi:hypothetical protein
MMEWTTQLLLVFICCGGLLLAGSAKGASGRPNRTGRNYDVIVDRNPFGLKPRPAPKTNEVVATPPEELFLTGLTSLGGLRAYFMSKAPPGKTPDYYNLGIGEREDSLEVLAIDPSAGTVTVRNAGIESVMSFKANGVKAPVAPTKPAGGPGSLARTVSRSLRGTPAAQRVRTIPSRTVRTTPASSSTTSSARSKVRPYAAAQDTLILELQRITNPDIHFPPPPIPLPTR